MLETMKHILFFLSVSVLFFCLSITESCTYDEYVPELVVVDPTDTISFSQEIVPIFELKCNSSFCHGQNAIPPDLTPARAFQSIINGDYINLVDPVSSDFYLWLNGVDGRDVMPPGGADPELNALFLTWIKQGALDN
jgi:hypothetical protein